jgi:sodium-dependent phosphate cotransporter
MPLPEGARHTSTKATGWAVWVGVAALVYLLLVGVGLVGDGFKWISGGAEGAERIFAFASNPLVGVILGTLATALVQSSSTVTSVVVGLVAGGVPVDVAVPMIMGANMGTTITNTIVSLGSLKDGPAFKRSFQAATVHDFFNLYGIVILLPLEVLFHPLERTAGGLARVLGSGADASVSDLNLVGAVTKPAAAAVVRGFDALPSPVGPAITIMAGLALIFVSVVLLGRLLRQVLIGRARKLVDRAIGRGPLSGVASGTVITVLVQSSSTTTSLVVPLAGAGVLTLRQVFPFVMGANIGTCVTALLAATGIDGPYRGFALQVALVQLLFNILGVVLFLFVPWLRDTPIRSAEWLGGRAALHRAWALAYVLIVFFVLPGGVLAAQSLSGNAETTVLEAESHEQELDHAESRVERSKMAIE